MHTASVATCSIAVVTIWAPYPRRRWAKALPCESYLSLTGLFNSSLSDCYKRFSQRAHGMKSQFSES